MIIEIKADNGKAVKFTNTNKDELVLAVVKDGSQLACAVLSLSAIIKGLAEINYCENFELDQG